MVFDKNLQILPLSLPLPFDKQCIWVKLKQHVELFGNFLFIYLIGNKSVWYSYDYYGIPFSYFGFYFLYKKPTLIKSNLNCYSNLQFRLQYDRISMASLGICIYTQYANSTNISKVKCLHELLFYTDCGLFCKHCLSHISSRENHRIRR